MTLDPHSATWEAVSRAAQEILAQARRRLEQPGLAPEATEFERGRIAAARAVLALAEPRTEIPVEAPAY
jgi:hypothetical protein